jgi:hypothetical protein
LEKEIGLSNGYLGTQLKRGADLGEGIMNKIINYCLDIAPEWLLTGNGPMLRDGQPAEAPNPSTDPPDAGREALYKEMLAELRVEHKREIAARDEKIEKLNRQLGAMEAKLGEREARGFRPEDLGGVRPADFPYTTSGKSPYHK